MDARLEQVRREAERIGRGAGRKFSRAAIEAGGAYARERHGDGASWRVVAEELGLIVATARRWANASSAPRSGFRSVKIVEPATRGSYAAVLPNGLRIEALDLAAVVALAKALS